MFIYFATSSGPFIAPNHIELKLLLVFIDYSGEIGILLFTYILYIYFSLFILICITLIIIMHCRIFDVNNKQCWILYRWIFLIFEVIF
jgi:hypothetical protein